MEIHHSMATTTAAVVAAAENDRERDEGGGEEEGARVQTTERTKNNGKLFKNELLCRSTAAVARLAVAKESSFVPRYRLFTIYHNIITALYSFIIYYAIAREWCDVLHAQNTRTNLIFIFK